MTGAVRRARRRHGVGRDVAQIDEHPEAVHLEHDFLAELRQPAQRGVSVAASDLKVLSTDLKARGPRDGVRGARRLGPRVHATSDSSVTSQRLVANLPERHASPARREEPRIGPHASNEQPAGGMPPDMSPNRRFGGTLQPAAGSNSSRRCLSREGHIAGRTARASAVLQSDDSARRAAYPRRSLHEQTIRLDRPHVDRGSRV